MGSVSRMFRTGGRATVTVCPASCEEAYTGSSLNAANKLSATKLEWLVSISSGRHISVYSDSCSIETSRVCVRSSRRTIKYDVSHELRVLPNWVTRTTLPKAVRFVNQPCGSAQINELRFD